MFGFNTFPDEGALELGYDIVVIWTKNCKSMYIVSMGL